ncbi:MAG: acyl-CoA desaturase [Candidatus Omnitrophica bacterium]|nr:acyl-CoA desaturase [Candidatus Omnitrophota bacterium]
MSATPLPHSESNESTGKNPEITFLGSLPFISVHLGCLLVFWVGFSWWGLAFCLALVGIRMFGITAGYHRYFSHRTFRTSRAFQFVLAWIGASAAQMGPLWWAAHHRHHHRFSDTEKDVHPPRKGFFWAHVGWILSEINVPTNMKLVRDLVKFPELRFLNEYYMIPPMLLAIALLVLGAFIPGVTPLELLAWGFFLSTTILYHLTFSINSLTHRFGRRRFETTDTSRNSFILGVLTMGEGWHNNHHYYPGSERQGFYWWEVDFTHYILKALSWFGIVWDLHKPPQEVLDRGKGVV